ncbi:MULTISPECIES: UDP-glucose--hexose-1-phosphate uridylyltransferase [Paenibacillus]|uniref:Galactose-1-phosphate uridylyltransferase n=1 Tax=Paenibacillus albilobatus TaxID=2716884 RepID=A0A919XJC4_9BACL|nr:MULTISPECIES: UDP-glucose--hexose-1-phosphate uridylyltransferase [Paenibacillus]GIO33996.1 galactose-1-phosphate uridylyltransferase [Paenibacillus albilobatus]
MNTNEANGTTELGQKALAAIEQLVRFALERRLIEPLDEDYSRNLLLSLFRFDEPYLGDEAPEPLEGPQPALDVLIDYGYRIGLIPENTDTYRDLLDAQIMGGLMPRPSEVTREFGELKEAKGIEAATDRFYQLSVDANYIRMDRVNKNVYWQHESEFGDIEITINLSKPEKSPKEIAMAKLLPPPVYPKCQLCRENVGYAGRVNHPARQNLRIIPLKLNGEPWFFQYSPYVYYNEHCIVFHRDHVPMKLTKDTFRRLLAFVDEYPHYFIGSNADLPIVGGSILTHDHFQGGRHTFPIQNAPKEAVFAHPEYDGVTVGIVKWPMSVLRLTGKDSGVLLELADKVYESWKRYSDPAADILAFSEENGNKVPHNTVTPIVRRTPDGEYEMDLVLRNNRTSERYPAGIFHPHQEMHHIKKENIGLIEVMGLAILPGRLKEELDLTAEILAGDRGLYEAVMEQEDHPLNLHKHWIGQLAAKYGTNRTKEEAWKLVQSEVGGIFVEILGHAGVYKRTETGMEAFRRFVAHLGCAPVQ